MNWMKMAKIFVWLDRRFIWWWMTLHVFLGICTLWMPERMKSVVRYLPISIMIILNLVYRGCPLKAWRKGCHRMAQRQFVVD